MGLPKQGGAGPRPIPLAPDITILEELDAQMQGAKWGLWRYALNNDECN